MAKKRKEDILLHNKIFAWLALGTGLLLLIPAVIMLLNLVPPNPSNPADQGFNWSPLDFVVAGILIYGTSSLFVLTARHTPRKYRLSIGLGFLAAFLYAWAELAVGVFFK